MMAKTRKPEAAHHARVQVVNRRQVEVPHRNRRGRKTGTALVTVHDGYRAVCQSCGWQGETTPHVTVASASAAGHREAS